MNRIMTLGQDQRWRRFVIAKAGEVGDGYLLDMACGTGDIAVLAKKKMPGCTVLGGDFSMNMLKEARRRFFDSGIGWQRCDANRLPYGDAMFDAVTFGYLLRNVADSAIVLAEVFRVLKPGGRVVCLDTTPPRKNFLYPFILFYFRFIIPLLGKLLASNADAYAYLTGSSMNFSTAEQLDEVFTGVGFRGVGHKKFMLGTIAVHWAVKESFEEKSE